MPTHAETIKCPNCQKIQIATIQKLIPWNDLTHRCEDCEYWITESDWEVVKETINV